MWKILLVMSVFGVGCGSKQPDTRDASVGTYTTVAVVPPVPTLDEADKVLALMKETNRILEECLMPSFGLNPKKGICEVPDTTCQVECKCCE